MKFTIEIEEADAGWRATCEELRCSRTGDTIEEAFEFVTILMLSVIRREEADMVKGAFKLQAAEENIKLLDVKEHDDYLRTGLYVVTLKFTDMDEPVVVDFSSTDIATNLGCGNWEDVNLAWERRMAEPPEIIGIEQRISALEEAEENPEPTETPTP